MSTPLPLDVRTGLRELATILGRRKTKYAVVGGIASGIRGRPRNTEDIDLVIDVPQLQLPPLLNELADAGFALDLHAAIRDWTQGGMLQIQYGDVPVDWLKPVLPCFAHLLDRARPEDWLGMHVYVATAEDLIVMKLLAQRTQDIFDIENLLMVNRGVLDLELIRSELAAVAPHDAAMSRFDELVQNFYAS